MRWRATGVVAFAVVLAACSAGSAGPVNDRTALPLPDPEIIAATSTSVDDRPDPTPTILAATEPLPDEQRESGGEVSPVLPSVDTEQAVFDGEEDPSFELGPEVVLDVDVARFPVDDAGVGGGLDGDQRDDASIVGEPTGWASVDAALEAELLRPGNTAASVAVSIGGDVVHRAAFGVRDSATGDPAEAGDRFRIASISKPITAITVLQLVEDGLASLDEPVGGLVAAHIGLVGVSASADAITLRQLLTHRSGFGTYQSTFFGSGAAGCVDAARQGLRNGASGGGYRYSNMNYCVAGLAIEALTGLSYEQAVYRYLLTPLGITGMRLAPTFDPGPDEVQHVSTAGRNYMETLGGAGAWIASPTDLVTIMNSLDVSTGGFKPLDAATVLSMITPSGGQLGSRGYGMGMISYGGNRFGHTGTIEATHAMVLNRGDGVTWAITVAGQWPGETTQLERVMNAAFTAGGFVAG